MKRTHHRKNSQSAPLIVVHEKPVMEECPHPCVSENVEYSVRVRNGIRRVGQNLKAGYRQGNWKDSKLCCAHGKSAHAQSVRACDVYDTQQYVERGRSCTHTYLRGSCDMQLYL